MNICIEGPDGSGKTTIAKLVAETLGTEYVRCPGSTMLGEMLRPVLKNMSIDINPLVRCLLFAAVDFDACSRYSSAVFDRTGLSGIIYRAATRKYAELSLLSDVSAYDMRFILPALSHVYLLDARDDILDARMGDRSDDNDEGTLLRNTVRKIYRRVPHDSCVRVDTSKMGPLDCARYIIADHRARTRTDNKSIYEWCMGIDETIAD